MQWRAGQSAADRTIQLIGLPAGAVGSAILVNIAGAVADWQTFLTILLYSACLVTMLGCSAAYHFTSNASRREFFRKLDHAAIFLMIAGTYTPFTCRLGGIWAVGMTAVVWLGALLGVGVKLIRPRRLEGVSVVAYLALGWMILLGIRPLLDAVGVSTVAWIGIGGALYSIGVGFHLWRTLPFNTAIWHGFVLAAAGCHYTAILHGVMLAPSR
jgi:hemolysin III